MGDKDKKIAIVWFRHDLRLTDHPALTYALKNADKVIPVFIWPHADKKNRQVPGAASRWWLHRSLSVLQKDLQNQKSRLIIRKGESLGELKALVKETGALAIFWNRCYEPAERKQDLKIEKELVDNGLFVKTFRGGVLFEPHEIKNKQGTPYKVFTSFWNCVCAKDSIPKPLPKPRNFKAPLQWPRSVKVEMMGLNPKTAWDQGLCDSWQPGEVHAKCLLAKFQKKVLLNYATNRDYPYEGGTSRLSPYLHFGQISPATVWHALPQSRRAIAYRRQLIWCEFASYLLYHFPKTPDQPLDQKFSQMPWKRNKRALTAWQKGQTGYPIVDAGMRELWHTGWMHNRVRMIVASFLVKDLMISWKEGARWFWDTLVDADLANNTMGWQWIAGCGADAAPFFRVFNPVSQGEKFDPEGLYVRQWIPEISKLPNKWIHKPWMVSRDEIEQKGIVLGENYPKPIVEHDRARQQALKAYERIKN